MRAPLQFGRASDDPALAWRDRRLRAAATLFYAVAIVIALIAVDAFTLPVPTHPIAINVLAVLGALAAAWLLYFPWDRLHRNVVLTNTITAIILVALLVANSGGTASPFASYYFMVTIAAALYYRRLVAIGVGVLVAIATLLPLLYGPGDAVLQAHLLLSAPLHLCIAAIGQLMAGELARKYSDLAERPGVPAFMAALQPELPEALRPDPLAQMLNRTGLEARINQLLLDHQSSAAPFGLVFLDIDHFADLNDRYGHACGDDVLRQIALLIQNQSRSSDIIARYGGEEFVIVLPQATAEVALRLGERLRLAVEQFRFWTQQTSTRLAVTISLGIAACPEDGTDTATLLQHADASLQLAKRAGRNQVRWLREHADA